MNLALGSEMPTFRYRINNLHVLKTVDPKNLCQNHWRRHLSGYSLGDCICAMLCRSLIQLGELLRYGGTDLYKLFQK